MEKLLAAATALPAGETLTWARAGADNVDELADWSLKVGSAALYKVHTAMVATGPRHAVNLRSAAIAASGPIVA